jgi:hypothetical protein
MIETIDDNLLTASQSIPIAKKNIAMIILSIN